MAGAAIGLSAFWLWRGESRGAWLYTAMLLATAAWAIWEVGLDGWGLLVRLATFVVLGIPLLARAIRGDKHFNPRLLGMEGASLIAVGAAAAMLIGVGSHALRADREDPLMKLGTLDRAPEALPQPLAQIIQGDWQHFGNDRGGTRFSPLEQITPQNVDKLEVAWEADIGPADPKVPSALQVTPINIGDALYVCNGRNTILGLDAETGRERWRFDMTREEPPSGKPCRGVAYYQVSQATGMCSERIFAGNQSGDLFAVDAATGKACADFGVEGRVRLRDGMGDVPPGYHYVSSAPQVIRGKVVVGGAIMDGQFWGEPTGVIRAFDAITGQLAWAFDPGRPPGTTSALGEAFAPATPNSWAPISADEELGLVYLPTGNATPDFYGAQRRPFDEEVSSSVIALDAETGELRWRFQTTHHDIWDYDVPSQPTLIDLPTPHGIRKALIQPTKRGEVFVIDRTTGEPIKSCGRAAGAARRRCARRTSLADAALLDRHAVVPATETARVGHVGPYAVRSHDLPQAIQAVALRGHAHPSRPRRPDDLRSGLLRRNQLGQRFDQCRSRHHDRQLDAAAKPRRTDDSRRGFGAGLCAVRREQRPGKWPASAGQHAVRRAAQRISLALGMPCTAPPWGLLTAVDLVSGRVIWSQPIGTGRDSGPFGIESHLPITMGVPMSGGSITTRSGLVFIGATVERTFRAFDVATGEELWHARLPAAGVATPMTYLSKSSGRQFVVIAAGGRPGMVTRLDTKIVAFALPSNTP